MLPRTTRVAALDGSGRATLIERDIPELADGHVLVAVRASMFSPGSELSRAKRFRTAPDPALPARPFGYSNAGTVVAAGAGVTRFGAGDEVACMGGGMAYHADYAVVPQNLCTAIPSAVSFDHAASVHLAATALNAIRRTVPLFGENGIVAGLGIVGQFCCQFLQASGCHAMAMDPLPGRRAIALSAGAEGALDPATEDVTAAGQRFSGGFGIDFGVIAFGGDASAAFQQLYEALRQQPDSHHTGRIVIVGGAHVSHGFGASLGNVDVRSAARTGPGYHDSRWEAGQDYPPVLVEWSTQRNLSESLRAMADGRIRVEPLITHRFSLDRVADAVDLLIEQPGDAVGVVLQP